MHINPRSKTGSVGRSFMCRASWCNTRNIDSRGGLSGLSGDTPGKPERKKRRPMPAVPQTHMLILLFLASAPPPPPLPPQHTAPAAARQQMPSVASCQSGARGRAAEWLTSEALLLEGRIACGPGALHHVLEHRRISLSQRMLRRRGVFFQGRLWHRGCDLLDDFLNDLHRHYCRPRRFLVSAWCAYLKFPFG